MNDTDVVDAIATYLGTRSEWPGADALTDIANLIAAVRPHPGSWGIDYRTAFREATGRDVPPQFDAVHGGY